MLYDNRTCRLATGVEIIGVTKSRTCTVTQLGGFGGGYFFRPFFGPNGTENLGFADYIVFNLPDLPEISYSF